MALRLLDKVPKMIQRGELSHALAIAALACFGNVDFQPRDG